MKSVKVSRGGAKPKMLTDGKDWGIDTGQGYEKLGIYEFSERFGELARRVELPHWLADARVGLSPVAFKKAISEGQLIPPKTDIAESGGHIWLKPSPEFHWVGSAVGIDEIIFTRLEVLGPKFKSIRFVGYDPGYDLAFQWRISASEFLKQAQRVQTKPSFMPQWMVPISALNMVLTR